ncbi:peroxisome biogenesis protein 16-like [Pyrus ussuriensis x Pyrus communis]|uniref:Peroxisomal membrane protein PEX16 n=1 Tax=Pyrus ussuriensis x Pyrus communis TaxID=2448454 RepID=A0A5N5F081_9ROSA|nr:peroxisome biogenesis protein 16-like [Pyrus ussuriensis x Pyrus communis]
MEAYKKWVRENRDYVHSLESLANGLTWLLPERFSESEIGPEAVTTLLGITTAINEHIIATSPTSMHVGSTEGYSFPYALCISALKDLETLVEVVGQQYFGDEKKWNFIAITEAMKVLVRLALFRNNGYKMLLHGGETPNDEMHVEASTPQRNIGGFTKPGLQLGPGYLRNNHGQYSCNLEGRALSTLNRFGENARMVSEPVWLRRVQHQQAIMEPPTPVVEKLTLSTLLSEKSLRGAFYVFGEALFITRPLIYVLFIRKYGVRSWIPWFLSLAVDFTGMGILSRIESSRDGTKEQHFHLSVAEKNEVKRRKLLWALYLMRDPFFSKYTRQKLESAEKVLEPVPIVGFLTAKLVELLIGAQTRYTYMSGS